MPNAADLAEEREGIDYMKMVRLNLIPAWARPALLVATFAILAGSTPMMADCTPSGSDGGSDSSYYVACYANAQGGHVQAFALAYQICACANLFVRASATYEDVDIIAVSSALSTYGASSSYGEGYTFSSSTYTSSGGGDDDDGVATCRTGD